MSEIIIQNSRVEEKRLTKQSPSLWQVLGREQIIKQLLLTVFVIYTGYVVSNWMDWKPGKLMYILLVVAFLWYFMDVFIEQWNKERGEHFKKMQAFQARLPQLVAECFRSEYQEFSAEKPKAVYDLSRSLLAYAMDWPLQESKHIFYGDFQGIQIYKILLQEDTRLRSYWFLYSKEEQQREGTTLVLPKMYKLDKFSSFTLNQNLVAKAPQHTVYQNDYISTLFRIDKKELQALGKSKGLTAASWHGGNFHLLQQGNQIQALSTTSEIGKQCQKDWQELQEILSIYPHKK